MRYQTMERYHNARGYLLLPDRIEAFPGPHQGFGAFTGRAASTSLWTRFHTRLLSMRTIIHADHARYEHELPHTWHGLALLVGNE